MAPVTMAKNKPEKVITFAYPGQGLPFLIKPFFRSADRAYSVTRAAGALLAALGLLALLDWATPRFLFSQSAWQEWRMRPLAAICFAILGAVLLFYNRQPFSLGARVLIVAAGILTAGTALVRPAVAVWFAWDGHPAPPLFWLEHFAGNPFEDVSVFILGVSLALYPALMRRHRPVGDGVGGLISLVLTAHVLFLLSYLPGTPFQTIQHISLPPFGFLCGGVLLGTALLARLGPGYFPIRPFVGPSVRAVLYRKILPVTVAGVLIYSLLGRSMAVFMNPALSSITAMLSSVLIMTLVVMRSSKTISRYLQEALQESEKLYTDLVTSLQDHGVILLSPQGQVVLWNRGAQRVTGYGAEEVVGEEAAKLISQTNMNFEGILESAAAHGSAQAQGWMERKDGSSSWVEMAVNALQDETQRTMGFSVVIRDLTERKKTEDRMQASLREKEVLLKEIHHRVKNNLQVISSLLRMQSEKIRDKETLALFSDSQDRLRAMATVHEYLYQSQDLARICFPDYVASLVRNLARTYSPSGTSQLQIRVDYVFLSLDVAVPCGLIITELVSNAFKHAYPGRTGSMDVSFRALPDLYELSVADEGVGLPEGLVWERSTTLGLRLVHLLTKQLQGKIRLERGSGTKFVITFKEPENSSRDKRSQS